MCKRNANPTYSVALGMGSRCRFSVAIQQDSEDGDAGSLSEVSQERRWCQKKPTLTTAREYRVPSLVDSSVMRRRAKVDRVFFHYFRASECSQKP